MTLKRLVLSFCLVFAVYPSFAQQPVAPTTSPIVNILSTANAIRGVSMNGTVTSASTSGQTPGTVNLNAYSQGWSQIALTSSSGTTTEVRNGFGINPSRSWTGSDATTMTSTLTDTRLPHPAWFFPFFVMISGLGSPGYWYSDIGPQTWQGKSVEHIAVWQRLPDAIASTASAALQQQVQTDLYLDSTTYLPVSLVFNVQIDPNLSNEFFVPSATSTGNVVVEVDYSNYQNVQGVQVPCGIQVSSGSTTILGIQVSSVSLNGADPVAISSPATAAN
jgi:hypothetical protein